MQWGRGRNNDVTGQDALEAASPRCLSRREMAAALSRALKLPGKKGSELGDYDPLTQADSDDESEEDDLVLNYPRNGLGRDGCLGSSKLRAGRSERLNEAPDDEEEEEEEDGDDDDEWTDRLPGKSRRDRGELKDGQFWSHRDLGGREKMGEERGAAGMSGGSGLGMHGAEAEKKRLRAKNVVRSAFFLVPLVCAALIVLLCVFLIPCQRGELEKKLQWEKALGVEVGGTQPALTLWDVDGDSVEDVLLAVTEWTNETHPSQRNKNYSAVAVSAVSGQLLWRKVMPESVKYIQCGLRNSTQPSTVCLLIGSSILMAVNGTTGERLWTVTLKNIESQAVLLPDIEGDSVPDLLVATLPTYESLDLYLIMISGQTGALLGRPVSSNLTGQGKLIGPLLHETQQGAFYILFGLGNVQAISLQDIYLCAFGDMAIPQPLRRKDKVWEGLNKTNFSNVIHIHRGSESVEFLLPLVTDWGIDRNSLDTVSNLNSIRSDWVLVYGASMVSVVRQRDLRKEWAFNLAPIHSQPALGHFNNDRILDIFVQHSENGIMQAKIINGASGSVLWAADFVCPYLVLETSAISTSTGQSAFLFWASDPIRAQRNVTRTTTVPGVVAARPLIRRLFLLHPAYPTVLLELSNTTDTAVTSAVSYQEHLKDATYITLSSRPTPDSKPGARIVKSTSVRAAISSGRIVRLMENGKTEGGAKPGSFELNTFFRRLYFKRQ
ncbi:protein FAM234B [Kryptolebias marmoratus]|uniref:Family with sequence similarity 234 member B n=1 Tax=Kryptolebias marmoratus TaxID=37003 RepID=A0A3Q3G2Z1_KRYMA|nr:protein FAM234B [Kryptolebias marmoratus]